MQRSRKLVAVVGTLAIGTAASGVAVALWSATGSGSGNAQAALNAVSVTVNAVTGAPDLYPGFAGGDVHFTLTNTNPYGVTFTSMTPGAITSSNEAGCPASNVSVVSKAGLALSVAGNGTSGAQSVADAVTLASVAPNGCQGVTFTIALTLSGSQT